MKAESEISAETPAAATQPRNNWRALLPLLVIAAAVIVLDRIVKLMIIDGLGPASNNHVAPILSGWLQLRYVENTGAAFGLFQGGGWFLAIVAAAVAIAIIYTVPRMNNENMAGWARWPAFIGLALVLGGALGNLIDRILWGYVVDFVDPYGMAVTLSERRYQFAVFNVADSAITVGIGLLLVSLLLGSREPKAATKPEEAKS